jgi:hypothetical protein
VTDKEPGLHSKPFKSVAPWFLFTQATRTAQTSTGPFLLKKHLLPHIPHKHLVETLPIAIILGVASGCLAVGL